MRFRLMATYRGVPYEAGVGPSHGDVVLFAACPPPEELGFEPATGHWRKQVIWAEVDALWESRPVGLFRGEPCIVLDDLGDRLHIAYLGTEADRAALLGYWQVDRGVFELLAPRDEVSSLTEERVDKPLLWVPPHAEAPHAEAPHAETLDAEALDAETLDAEKAAEQQGYPYGLASWPTPPPATHAQRANGGAPPADTGPAAGTAEAEAAAGGIPAVDGPGASERGASGSRSARRQRVTTREVFSELADLAAIPRGAYALEAEVDGAMCLLEGKDGFEVFLAVDGARHEARLFADEEAAYFYLFGVLAAEAIRSGALIPAAPAERSGQRA